MTPTPNLIELYRLFRSDAPIPDHELIAPEAMPEPYRRLLVHPHHMTVTVEQHYGSRVHVIVLERLQRDEMYCRKILLRTHSEGRTVLFGIVRIRLSYCGDRVREAIVEEKTPLGRILIEHDVLRRIEPTDYFRLTTGPMLTQWFDLTEPQSAYGRLGIIYCDEQPAIELLEILAPIRS